MCSRIGFEPIKELANRSIVSAVLLKEREFRRNKIKNENFLEIRWGGSCLQSPNEYPTPFGEAYLTDQNTNKIKKGHH